MTREKLLKQAKPILFNTEMVQAILEGRKTVTRRVIKPKSKKACGISINTRRTDGVVVGVYECDEGGRDFDNALKPPFKKGDYLYVRETWTAWSCSECEGECVADNGNGHCTGGKYLYKADGEIEGMKWKPSIHMPKEAARIFLKVNDVRVERLKDINEEGALKEGILPMPLANYIKEFAILWNSTIKKAGLDKYGWEANPRVWVIEFERVEV